MMCDAGLSPTPCLLAAAVGQPEHGAIVFLIQIGLLIIMVGQSPILAKHIEEGLRGLIVALARVPMSEEERLRQATLGGRLVWHMSPLGNLTRMGLWPLALVAGWCQGAEPPRPLLRDFIGLNGHTVQFKPALYHPVGRLVRDYHPVAWDLEKATSVPAPWPLAKNKVDWSKVYGAWKASGWTTDACLMFESVALADWADLERDARAYGEAFAREFGPTGHRQLVESVELGNEPGKWSDADYTRMFRAMAEGVRKGDPRMKIATCNLTAGASGDYDKSVGCIAGMPQLVDVLTIHSYAQLTGWPTWQRSFPEDPALTKYLADVAGLCAWRDAHLPGKPVWITEFGYDSTTQPQEKSGDFAKWQGVSDEQQAQWLVRSLLVFSAMPVERAYIYFFDDQDKASVHASSGLTRNFQPKPAFHAVSHLQQTLGEFRFRRVVTDEPGKLRVHEYRHDATPRRAIWAVWAPNGEPGTRSITLRQVPGKLVASSRMPLTASPALAGEARQRQPGTVELPVGGSPVYLVLEP